VPLKRFLPRQPGDQSGDTSAVQSSGGAVGRLPRAYLALRQSCRKPWSLVRPRCWRRRTEHCPHRAHQPHFVVNHCRGRALTPHLREVRNAAVRNLQCDAPVMLHGPTSPRRWGPLESHPMSVCSVSPERGCRHVFEYGEQPEDCMQGAHVEAVLKGARSVMQAAPQSSIAS